MSRNHILDEVWNAREQLLTECGGDWSRYLGLLREDQAKRVSQDPQELADSKAALQTFLDGLPTVDLSDPIIDEVHRIRQQLWDEYGGTREGFVACLKQHEAEHPELMVTKAELDARRKSSTVPSVRTRP